MNQETRNFEAEKHILDSGERREFESGAVRDIQEGKGRFDLLPLGEVARYFEIYDNLTEDTSDFVVPSCVNNFIKFKNDEFIYAAIRAFIGIAYEGNSYKAIMEVAKHYEEGAKKYAERNWEKGINFHCYIDSAMRHYFKYLTGWEDEPHDRAVLWNLFCLLWTYHNKPELDDLPRYIGERERRVFNGNN